MGIPHLLAPRVRERDNLFVLVFNGSRKKNLFGDEKYMQKSKKVSIVCLCTLSLGAKHPAPWYKMAKCSQSHEYMLNYGIFGDIACRKANVWVLVFTGRGNGPFLNGQTMQIIEIQQSRPLARHQHIEHIRLERI